MCFFWTFTDARSLLLVRFRLNFQLIFLTLLFLNILIFRCYADTRGRCWGSCCYPGCSLPFLSTFSSSLVDCQYYLLHFLRLALRRSIASFFIFYIINFLRFFLVFWCLDNRFLYLLNLIFIGRSWLQRFLLEQICSLTLARYCLHLLIGGYHL
jgi:hypothetical protein